jgi:hypothetical protein
MAGPPPTACRTTQAAFNKLPVIDLRLKPRRR